jgi:hypothetical protein
MTTAELLVKLANDSSLMTAFRASPREFLQEHQEEFGLSDEQIDVLSNGVLTDIRYLVEADFDVPREADEGVESTTVSFVRPVWVRPVWGHKSSDESSDAPAE